ncbi:MAG TPA: hypothetical protein ENG48_09135 [Candidatus Atribacteria bacterium]|nr:hypothetical protein [Candidatus Atribacteria bacterium]
MGNGVSAYNITSWDFQNLHVPVFFTSKNSDELPSEKPSISINDIIESGSVLIAAGPADLDSALGESAVDAEAIKIIPIGLVESASVNMSKPLSRIFEIGSKQCYIIPGKTVGSISLNRVFFDGMSIMKALYAGEIAADCATNQNKFVKWRSNPKKNDENEIAWEKYQNISSGDLAMNLQSSFFDHPIGIAMYFRDQENDNVGQTYFEGCRIGTYSFGIQANMNVLTEGVSLDFVRCRPFCDVNSNEANKGKNYADINIVSGWNRYNPVNISQIAEQ